jgi:uncharacterized protein (DUF427 family)
MGVRMRDLLMAELGNLRYEPIDKRIRGVLDGRTVVDSRRALLVWEPWRVVPTYAVPVEDVRGQVLDQGEVARDPDAGAGEAPRGAPRLLGRRVLDPSVPFEVRTTAGRTVTIRTAATERTAAGFVADDPQLADHVIVDFDGFDTWWEEDEQNVAHPRDPFHRIDIVHSSRHVLVRHDGQVLGESTAPRVLFEPPLPPRYYLPREDVRADLLVASGTTTWCAYKGRAAYLSTATGPDVAWSYPEPLREAREVTDRIAFFDERVELVVDGVALERPVTPWSR